MNIHHPSNLDPAYIFANETEPLGGDKRRQ